jgi:cell division protein FtsI (penicillin-binding protein 3)/stage V sporulation protein D (sporulation-specific penicillin-binding protein)
MNPVSGDIMALANYPSFDPNGYSSVKDLDVFKNSATQDIFEPGSIFKPITIAGAIDMGVITSQTTYQDPGVIKIGKWSIYNYMQRTYPGDITMTQVLDKSINTGAVFAESRLGNENFLRYVEEFGIFEATGIDLKEVYSSNSELKKGREINFATASFGQGIEVTPIQMVKAFSAVVNGGDMVEPHVVAMIGDEEVEKEITRESIISDKTTSQLVAMLTSVVENGYGKPARIQGYYMGGKTGTSEMSYAALGENKTGYSEKTWQSFIGFAPSYNPQFVILVKLDNPGTKTAEYSAVPIFKELAKYIIDCYQIPPDYDK